MSTLPSLRDPLPGRSADVSVRLRAESFELDLAGTVHRTTAYNASVPGPLLRATAGELIEVTLNNGMVEPTSIHWHGLAVPNAVDGVPDVTQPAIGAGKSFVYRFIAPDPGTYWFHPHHGVQLDKGLYAPLIVDDPAEPMHYDTEQLIVLDDWLDGGTSSPEAELERLRGAGGTTSVKGAMNTSPLLGGDAGDVSYLYHLINGRPLADPLTLEPRPDRGDRVRFADRQRCQ